MPTIRLIAILNHLGPQARFALAEALDRVAPGHDIDSAALFEQFVRELDNISPLWQRVPENMVMPDCRGEGSCAGDWSGRWER